MNFSPLRTGKIAIISDAKQIYKCSPNLAYFHTLTDYEAVVVKQAVKAVGVGCKMASDVLGCGQPSLLLYKIKDLIHFRFDNMSQHKAHSSLFKLRHSCCQMIFTWRTKKMGVST
jgi:hypothetical protein